MQKKIDIKIIILTLPMALLLFNAPVVLAEEGELDVSVVNPVVAPVDDTRVDKSKNSVKAIVNQFKGLDRNGDGKIVVAEYEATTNKMDFAVKDRNNDGILSVGEMLGEKAYNLLSSKDKVVEGENPKMDERIKKLEKTIAKAKNTIEGNGKNGEKNAKANNKGNKDGVGGKSGGGNKGNGGGRGGGKGGGRGGGKGGGRK